MKVVSKKLSCVSGKTFNGFQTEDKTIDEKEEKNWKLIRKKMKAKTLDTFLAQQDFSRGRLGYLFGGEEKDLFFKIAQVHLSDSDYQYVFRGTQNKIIETSRLLEETKKRLEQFEHEDPKLGEALTERDKYRYNEVVLDSMKDQLKDILQQIKTLDLKETRSRNLIAEMSMLESEIKEIEAKKAKRQEYDRVLEQHQIYQFLANETSRLSLDLDSLERDIKTITSSRMIRIVTEFPVESMTIDQIQKAHREMNKSKKQVVAMTENYRILRQAGVQLHESLWECLTVDERLLFELHQRLPESERNSALTEEEKVQKLKHELQVLGIKPIPYKTSDCHGEHQEKQIAFVRAYQAWQRKNHRKKVKAVATTAVGNSPEEGARVVQSLVGPVFESSTKEAPTSRFELVIIQ